MSQHFSNTYAGQNILNYLCPIKTYHASCDTVGHSTQHALACNAVPHLLPRTGVSPSWTDGVGGASGGLWGVGGGVITCTWHNCVAATILSPNKPLSTSSLRVSAAEKLISVFDRRLWRNPPKHPECNIPFNATTISSCIIAEKNSAGLYSYPILANLITQNQLYCPQQ